MKTKKKIALIFGITGQDGSYLSEFLLNKNYIVHGVIRRSSSFNTSRINHLYQDPHIYDRNLILHYGDMTDSMNLTKIIKDIDGKTVIEYMIDRLLKVFKKKNSLFKLSN